MTPYLSILSALFLWSSLGVVVRLSDLSEINVIFYSSLIAAVFQSVILLRKGVRGLFPDRRHLSYLLLLSCVGLLNTFAFYYAFKHTTIANAVLAHYIAPVLVAFLAAIFLGEKITGLLVITIVVSSAGLLIMLGGFSGLGRGSDGIIAGLVSGCAYAVIIILARSITPRLHPLVMSLVPNAVITCLLLPFASGIPQSALWYVTGMGIVHSTVAPMLYYWGMKYVSANTTAVLGYLEPVMAIVFSILILNELPGFRTLVGGLLIIGSGWMTVHAAAKGEAG